MKEEIFSFDELEEMDITEDEYSESEEDMDEIDYDEEEY